MYLTAASWGSFFYDIRSVGTIRRDCLLLLQPLSWVGKTSVLLLPQGLRLPCLLYSLAFHGTEQEVLAGCSVVEVGTPSSGKNDITHLVPSGHRLLFLNWDRWLMISVTVPKPRLSNFVFPAVTLESRFQTRASAVSLFRFIIESFRALNRTRV